jgi:hypothetical protein
MKIPDKVYDRFIMTGLAILFVEEVLKHFFK